MSDDGEDLAAAKRDAEYYREHCDRMSREQGTILSARAACEQMRKERDELRAIVSDLAEAEPRGTEPGECGVCGAGFSAGHDSLCAYSRAAAWKQQECTHPATYDRSPPVCTSCGKVLE